MVTKGTILKKRIKECGYTQEQFAEESGISLSALKKYISDTTKYDCDIMMIFSEKLNCSLDYLMGITETPQRELQTVKDKIGLDDNVIEYLQSIHDNNDIEANQIMTKTLNAILGDSELLNRMLMYLYGDEIEEINLLYKIYREALGEDMIGISGATLTAIIEELSVLKSRL